jgi:hypothetical protein
MTFFKSITCAAVVAMIVVPTLAAGQMPPSNRYINSVGNATNGTPVFDVPPARNRAYGAGLDQISRGLDARDDGKLDKACKHFRKAERHFRSANSIREREWSKELAQETCPST